MKSNILIPKKINVGFQNRSDTYTKKLAYIIYYDEKGTLRKETSWQGWRDKDIESIIHENTPISGFVLNKKVGDYSSDWNHRQAYVRVYDPRDFEFEITIENLLYILENASSIKGKGLEGDFIYGWDGKDLLLMPTSSPDYEQLTNYNEILFNNETIKAKDLILGATYKTKQNEEYIYMGRYDTWYSEYISRDSYDLKWNNKGKEYVFCTINRDRDGLFNFYHMKSINKKLISIIDEKCVDNYSELFDLLESKTFYSPVDNSKDIITPYNLEEFKDGLTDNQYNWMLSYRDKDNNKYKVRINKESKRIEQEIEIKDYSHPYFNKCKTIIYETIEEVFDVVKPVHLDKYLTNGRFYRREY